MTSSNQVKKKVAESEWGLFFRGIGSGKRPKRATDNIKTFIDTDSIVFKDTIKVPIDITQKYSKASNDMNSIHLNNEVAKRAGLPGIVVHGMCTTAMTAQGFIKGYLDNASDLLSLGVRFSAPVFPGNDLMLEVSKTSEENKLAFHVVRISDGTRVIRDGVLEIRV